MALFDEILNAVNNPNQQASLGQLQGILSTVQQLSGQTNMDSSTMQTLLSTVGSYMRSSLQQTRANAGADQAQNLVNQYSGVQPNQRAVEAMLSAGMQHQLVQDLIQRTGLDARTVQSLLPMLIPIALQFLQSGTNTRQPSTAGENSVLSTFLDSDGDGDVDLGDAFNVAGRFVSKR